MIESINSNQKQSIKNITNIENIIGVSLISCILVTTLYIETAALNIHPFGLLLLLLLSLGILYQLFKTLNGAFFKEKILVTNKDIIILRNYSSGKIKTISVVDRTKFFTHALDHIKTNYHNSNSTFDVVDKNQLNEKKINNIKRRVIRITKNRDSIRFDKDLDKLEVEYVLKQLSNLDEKKRKKIMQEYYYQNLSNYEY